MTAQLDPSTAVAAVAAPLPEDVGNKLTPREFIELADLGDLEAVLYDLIPAPYATPREQWLALAKHALTRAVDS